MRQKLTTQALRYALTGAGGFVFVFVLAFGLILSGFSIEMAANIAILPLAILKFFAYKYWVFEGPLPRWIREPSLYIAVVLLGWGLFVGFQYGLEYFFGLTERAAFWITAVIVGVVRFLFFRRVFSPGTSS